MLDNYRVRVSPFDAIYQLHNVPVILTCVPQSTCYLANAVSANFRLLAVRDAFQVEVDGIVIDTIEGFVPSLPDEVKINRIRPEV